VGAEAGAVLKRRTVALVCLGCRAMEAYRKREFWARRLRRWSFGLCVQCNRRRELRMLYKRHAYNLWEVVTLFTKHHSRWFTKPPGLD
jgi:hypothetical protein